MNIHRLEVQWAFADESLPYSLCTRVDFTVDLVHTFGLAEAARRLVAATLVDVEPSEINVLAIDGTQLLGVEPR